MLASATWRRVAITGLGVVSCCGTGKDAFFDGLMGPGSVGERHVPDFDPSLYMDAKEARQTDRFAQFSLATALQALEDAGELGTDPIRTGVIYATGVGGL